MRAVNTWGTLGGLIGGQLSNYIYGEDRRSPTSQGASTVGSWVGSVAGTAMGATMATEGAV